MQTPQQLRETYNTIANDYHQDHLSDVWNDTYRQSFINSLPSGAYVLDLACGPGTDTQKLVRAGLRVEGIDLSEKLLIIAKKHNPDVTFHHGDIRTLPFDGATFDGVFAKAAVVHIPKIDMGNVLKEVSRVLKPRGVLMITVKQGQDERDVTENDYGYNYTRFFSYWKSEEFDPILSSYGFDIFQTNSGTNLKTTTTWLQYLAKKL